MAPSREARNSTLVNGLLYVVYLGALDTSINTASSLARKRPRFNRHAMGTAKPHTSFVFWCSLCRTAIRSFTKAL
jgi:hypothetical protein